jgi:ribosomal protein S18 acetylase RimI-like enzyme
LAVEVAAAVEADLPELAAIAARTFPLACPPSVTPQNITAFIEENLSEARFRDYLADPERAVLAARDYGRMVGYLMLICGVPDDEDVQCSVRLRPALELSKMYVLPDSHGAGVSAALMVAALTRAVELDARCVWLGVNQHNQRAQRFYTKHGFNVNGTRTFRLGTHFENDYVMVRPL